MKRGPSSRAASPTPTAFSGISNYRTESYRPVKGNAPSMPPIDYRAISRVHFNELSDYLADYLARSPPNSRTSARQKLTRLTIQQFHELSTDVYDELMRRKLDNAPFLPVRDDFHPKRNQARQKLATLPTTRFEDLSSDVYYELSRRYPEFKEDPSGGTSPYDEYPPNSGRPFGASRISNRSDDRPLDSGYGGSFSGRRSADRRKPSDDFANTSRRSQDAFAPSPTSRRKPSQDTTRSSDRERERDYPRGLNNLRHDRNDSSSTTTATNAASVTAAGRDVIIPNKSTMEEEYIEVPYGREAPEDTEPDSAPIRSAGFSEAPESASDYPTSPTSPTSPLNGLNALGARLMNATTSDDDDDDDDPPRNARNNFFGRSSAASDRSAGRNGRANVSEDTERLKRDYESKIAAMQSEISELKRDLSDAEVREHRAVGNASQVEQLTEDLAAMRRRAEEHNSTMKSLQKELDDVRETRLREQDREARRQREDEEEMQLLREQVLQLQDERDNNPGGGADAEVVDQLRNDMESLLSELSELSRRNDELENARESDRIAFREVEIQMREYKRKYEQAKTELRSVKATSQLFSQQPRLDVGDQLPVSPDGGLLDVHVTSFLSAIDSLLTAGRTNSPSKVLSPMKQVINAVSAIIDDVQAFEQRSVRDRQDVDVEALRNLRERAEATLSNLVVATKTHATSSGMSPVSLLDAAASHVSATVTDIGRTVSIRKASRHEQEQFAAQTAPSNVSSPVSTMASLARVDEVVSPSSPSHLRNGSMASNKSAGRSNGLLGRFQPSQSSRKPGPPSDNSSERTNSPPAIFDQPNGTSGVTSDESVGGGEDSWAELKPYLEAQTESIVYAIQSVLSDVRSTAPSTRLNENLAQIITIVSSILAVSNDNLPPGNAAQGRDILRDLGDHANRLSEVQNAEITKESRQVMAKSSFAIANAMKALMKL